MKDVKSTAVVPASATPLRRGARRALTILIAVAGLLALQPVPLSAQSYLLSEGFEGTGFENTGWTAFSSIDADYTAGALAGSQSLRCNGTSSFIQRPFVWTSDFNAYFQIRWIALAPYKFVADWVDTNINSVTRVVTEGFPNRFSIVHGGATAIGTTVLDTNITYHVWVEWTRGTGNNGTMKLFVSTNGVKPGTPEAVITSGTGTNAFAKFDIGPFDAASTTDVIYDRILLDDEPIGSNPGVNSPPTITSIANQTTPVSTAIGPVSFTVGDAETNASNLVLTGASSNTSVVPNANIVFGGSGSNRTVTITPASNQSGSTTITITVNDGLLSTNRSFLLTISPVNDAPVVALPAGVANYTENTAPVLLDAAATVIDIDSANFDGGALTVDFSSNGAPEDRLAIRHQGTGSGQIGVSGATVI